MSGEVARNTLTTIPAMLGAGSRRWQDRAALDFSGNIFSYAELDRLSNRMAHGLAGQGVARGDRVCTMLDNSMDQLLVWFGLSKLGAINVPLNTSLKGEFLRHQVSDSGAKLLIADAHYADRIPPIDDVAELQRLIIRDMNDRMIPSTRLDVLPFAALASDTETAPEVELTPADLAMIIYTSGTTGPSKGCMISHGYACHAGLRFAQGATIRDGDIFWTPLPLFHLGAAGFVLGCLQLGATASVYSSFSVSNFWPEIERSGATVACIISVMLVLIAEAEPCEAERRCHGQLRAVAGVPFPRALQDIWRKRFGVRDVGASGFGMTEATPMTFSPVDQPVPDDSSGRRYADFDVQVVDDEDNILPPGQAGELVARPNRPGNMFSGYWRRPEATTEAFRNLWFHTGDIGRFDEDGFFFFVDRKKDYLRKGGENISSYETEMALRRHPEVEDVAVHAAKAPGDDDGAEDEVMITVMRRAGSTLDAETLCRWSIDQLPHYAVPRFVAFTDSLPRNASGRTLKYQLRALGVTAQTWDRVQAGIIVRRR